MKTKEKKVKTFDTIKTFREIKKKMSEEMTGMSFEELKQYLSERKIKLYS